MKRTHNLLELVIVLGFLHEHLEDVVDAKVSQDALCFPKRLSTLCTVKVKLFCQLFQQAIDLQDNLAPYFLSSELRELVDELIALQFQLVNVQD